MTTRCLIGGIDVEIPDEIGAMREVRPSSMKLHPKFREVLAALQPGDTIRSADIRKLTGVNVARSEQILEQLRKTKVVRGNKVVGDIEPAARAFDYQQLSRLSRQLGAKIYSEGERIVASVRVNQREHIPVAFRNPEEAVLGMQYIRDQQKAEVAFRLQMADAEAKGSLPPVEKPFIFSELEGQRFEGPQDPAKVLDAAMFGERPGDDLTDPGNYHMRGTRLGLAQVIPVQAWLEPLGQGGKLLTTMMRRAMRLRTNMEARMLSQWSHAVKQAGLDEEDAAAGFATFIERGAEGYMEQFGRAPGANLEQLAQTWYGLTERVRNTAFSLGLDTPEWMAGRSYWPHKFHFGLMDKEAQEAAIARLTESGMSPEQAAVVVKKQGGTSRADIVHDIATRMGKTPAEAERVFNFMMRNSRKRSGSLEHERLNAQGYLTDVQKAPMLYFKDVAEKLGNAEVYGPMHHRAHAARRQIEAEFGARAGNLAWEAFMIDSGRRVDRMDGFFGWLYNWQIAKLSLSFMNNATQQFNTLMVGGMKNFMKGVLAVDNPLNMKLSQETRTRARQMGAIVNHALDDFEQNGMTSWMSEGPATFRQWVEEAKNINNPLLKGLSIGASAARSVGGSLFGWVEGINRGMSVYVGEHMFDDLLGALNRGGREAAQAERMLRELDLDPNFLRTAAPEDLHMAREFAALSFSDLTQGRAGVLTRPLSVHQHPFVKMFFQYKGFAMEQALFLGKLFRNYKHSPKDATRAIAALITVYPAAGYLLSTHLRAPLIGDTLVSRAMESLEDGDSTTADIIGAYAAAMLSTGSLSIVGDMALTAATGNEFAMRHFFVPPAAGTMLNAWQIAGSTFRGLVGSPVKGEGVNFYELERAFKTAGRELGGIGQAATHTFGQEVLGRELGDEN